MIGMEFEWDDAKNDACFERRGFDFTYAVRAFFDPLRIVAQGLRRDYGEDRYRLHDQRAGLCHRLHGAGFGRPHHFGAQGQPEGGRGL